ncbi:MAG TPA: hypothetical protein VFS67_28170 [Polyangiaceae bacterium]|jgi:hypothetical protein|nr:hypothetical protein [Polyangiaceae bacterium]
MTEEEKQSDAARSSPRPAPSQPAACHSSAVPSALAGPCETALQHVIELAQATLDAGELAEPSPQQRLTRALRELPPETALKLRTLMIAGRDGRGIHAVQTNLTLGDGDAAFGAAADDAGESGPLLAEYLRRGHALACAAGLDLEQPLASWGSVEHDLDARAWRSFGRQLAQSQPDDGQCLTVAPAKGQGVSVLYVRLGESGWWSFRALLERPCVTAIDRQGLALDNERATTASLLSLKAVAPLLRAAEGPALRRAAQAIWARVGAPAPVELEVA